MLCCEEECGIATLFITIDVPAILANDDMVIIPPGGSIDIPVLDNDVNNSDCTTEELTITIITAPMSGQTIVNQDGTINYIAEEGFTGVDEFTYELCCNEECDLATVNIVVGQAPIAVDDMDTTTVGEPITISVLDNDSDPDGDELIITEISEPNNGSAVIFNDNIVYVPDSGFVGIDTFTYVICDQTMLCDTATVIVVIEEDGNGSPVIVDMDGNPVDTLFNSTPINEPLSDCISVIDPDGDQIMIDIIGNGSNGTATVDNDTCFTYVPDMDFVGLDTLLIVACDDGNPPICDTVIYIIDVGGNQPPIAVNDTVSTMPNTPISIPVLDNDEEPDGDPLTLEIITDPVNGTALINQDGTIEYVPAEDFIGTDSLQYVICDDGMPPLCDTAWVFINVMEEELMIQANDDYFETIMDSAVFVNICQNDVFSGSVAFPIFTLPANGTIDPEESCEFTYTPDDGFVGEDCFIYVIQDETGLTDTAEVCINVLPDQRPELDECPVDGLEANGTFPKFLAPTVTSGGRVVPWRVNNIDVCCVEPKILIFNRWGNMVYKNEAYQPGDMWQGEHNENAGGNNQLVPDGTYFYCVVCPDEGGSGEQKNHTGFIHVETD